MKERILPPIEPRQAAVNVATRYGLTNTPRLDTLGNKGVIFSMADVGQPEQPPVPRPEPHVQSPRENAPQPQQPEPVNPQVNLDNKREAFKNESEVWLRDKIALEESRATLNASVKKFTEDDPEYQGAVRNLESLFPNPTEAQKAQIKKAAEFGILRRISGGAEDKSKEQKIQADIVEQTSKLSPEGLDIKPEEMDPVLNANLNDIKEAVTNKRADTKYLYDKQNELVRLRNEGKINMAQTEAALKQLGELYRVINDAELLRQHGGNINSRREQQMREVAGNTGIKVEEMLTNRKMRNKVFNDIFGAVDATPQTFFNEIFSAMTPSGRRYETFIDLMRSAANDELPPEYAELKTDSDFIKNIPKIKEDFLKFQKEREMRENLHNMNAILYVPNIKYEQLSGFIDRFSSDQGDIAHRTVGVKEMMDLYEMAIRESMAQNNGYLRPEAMRGTTETSYDEKDNEIITKVAPGSIETRAKALFKKYADKGLISVYTQNGKTVKPNIEDVDLTNDKEIDRVFNIASGMMIANQRLLSLAAESKLPPGGAAYSSSFLQDVLQSYSPYVHLLGKYNVTEKGLAAYLYKADRSKYLGYFRKIWRPGKLKDLMEKASKNPDKLVQGEYGENIHILRQNPNRTADIYTWLGWRVIGTEGQPSAAEGFLKAGKERMITRFAEKVLGRKYDLSNPDERVERDALIKQLYSSDDDTMAKNALRFQEQNGHEVIGNEKALKAYFNEYASWIGTGLRFEKLRGKLEPLEGNNKQQIAKLMGQGSHELKEAFEAQEEAEELFERMAELQAGRLYNVSPKIRARVLKRLGDMSPARAQQVISELALAETHLLKNREELIEKGESFDGSGGRPKVELNFDVIDESLRGDAQRFVNAVKDDYHHNKDKYLEEFVYQREFTHGFVLWSGDAPVDEFHFATLGSTGGFARKARDNKTAGDVSVKEIEMLSSLKHVKTPEDLMKVIEEIYNGVAQYDSGKAKQVIAEKVEGLIKFFQPSDYAKLPLLGDVAKLMGRGSFAQTVYGKSAAVWEAGEIRDFILELEHKGFITEEGAEKLQEFTPGRLSDAQSSIWTGFAELAALAVLLYMAKKATEQK